ncbi:MAG: hypothetical protein ACI8RD_014159 [Bacillariaceae sp.]|jgi:hypothetical protein
MRITSITLWLACTTFTSSTSAFSGSSTLGRSTRTEGRQQIVDNKNSKSIFPLHVASETSEAISVADMERGMGGRIESAFESAKERGEAAFVAFITAGYPAKEGTFMCIYVHLFIIYILVLFLREEYNYFNLEKGRETLIAFSSISN